MRICFYAGVPNPELFDLVEFYRGDIEALRKLGHDVRPARTPREIGMDWDLAWVWWQTGGVHAVLAARALRRPCVLVTALSHRDRTASGMQGQSRGAHLASRISLAAADLVLATSDDTRLGLVGERTRALRTLPLGVDVTEYRPGVEPREPFVLTISHLTAENVERKRILDVVRVAALVPDVRFRIVGEEREGAEAVRAEIARLGVGDRVELVGRVSAEEKRALLGKAAIYLQPTRYEAFGMAIAEAMASGAVVLSNAVGNVPDLVGETGVLVAPEAGAEQMAAALAGLLARDDLTERGEHARSRIEQRFSAASRIEGVRVALEDVTGGRRRRPLLRRPALPRRRAPRSGPRRPLTGPDRTRSRRAPPR